MPLDWSIGPIENEQRLDPESVTVFFHQVVEELWRRDDVVIVGRGSQKILASKPRTLHVRFVGTIQDRCKQVMAADSLTHVEAAKKILAIDKVRAHYLKHHHDADWTDSTLYHLVINSSLIPIDQAVKIITLSLRHMEN